MIKHIAVFILSLFIFTESLCASSAGGNNPEQCDYQTVTKVIDGDTFEYSKGVKVRLIGVDTPETVDPRKDIQWFGTEAGKKLRELILGRKVCLKQERDRTQDIDKYGRLLRYAWLEDFFVNAEIIRQGYGFVYTKYPFQYMEDFKVYERHARENNLGLWDREKQVQWEREVERNKSFAKTCGEVRTICPEEALKNIGRHRTVRFFVSKSYDSGRAVFFNSKNDFHTSDNFTAVIFEHDKKKFHSDPADYYRGKTIDVSGKIKSYEGRAEIIMDKQSQIRVVQ
ncbi:MAG: thermonuclease family protein [Nitrospirae bacterium]|nr:thermonuclease family protein [Nitrospirota bacterium]